MENFRTQAHRSDNVHIQNPGEIEYWSDRLHCTNQQLIEAVSKVGSHIRDVKEYLFSEEIRQKDNFWMERDYIGF